MTPRAIPAFLAAIIVLAVGSMTGCAASTGPVPEIVSVEYSQSQAIPDFDDTVRTTTAAGDIAALTAVLDEYRVTGDYSGSADGCPGGRSTDVAYTTASDGTVTLRINGTCEMTDFERSLDELVTSWRQRG